MRTLALIASLALILGLAACSDGDGDGECVNGRACVCTGDCAKSCGGDQGGGCSFECPAGATCNFSCPGGGCSANGALAKSLTIDCGGKTRCDATCGDDTETCKITSCTSSCNLTCNGASTCENACDLLGGCATSP